MIHNRFTTEGLITIIGKCRCSWKIDHFMKYYEAHSFSSSCVISTGVQKRLEKISFDEPNTKDILMFLIWGNAIQAEFSQQLMEKLSTRVLFY